MNDEEIQKGSGVDSSRCYRIWCKTIIRTFVFTVIFMTLDLVL